ncbi:MAG: 4'-phosphopantetheinyl transferase superfamily protein [Burkholderiaceae bacterium]|nr:4'-phosphopantetheinyl transferase superfamily protein [Burkholderiaceae bacterium]
MGVLTSIDMSDIVLAHGCSLALVLNNPLDGRRTVATALRLVLARITGMPPEKLRLDRTEQGKPFLVADVPVLFNVSHARDHSLIALSHRGPVGCDIEGRFQSDDVHRLSPLVLHPEEQHAIASLDGKTLQDAFKRCWVRKESVLKARGTGFGADPQVVMVGFGDAPTVCADPQGRQLYLHDGPLVAGNMTAVASEDAACSWYSLRG